MKWINYHHLIYFKEIAKQGSVSKASKVLKVGQPALSSQLKNLEEYLGIRLFERRNRRLILTEPGRVTLEYANKISDLGQELIQLIDDKVFTNQVNLSVGALDSIPKHLICDIVDFAHKKTDCFLSIYEESMDTLVRMLLAHQVEIIISDHENNSFKNQSIFSKRILKRSISAYASPKFKSLKKNFPLSLENRPIIMPTLHTPVRAELDNFFALNEINPKIIAETQDTSLQKILSTKGDGVIFMPEFAMKEHVKDKKLVKLGKMENVFVEYFLIYTKRIIENPALELVLMQDFDKMRLG